MVEVFKAESTVEQWDNDYYPKIALRLYDWAIADMLKIMKIEPDATVLDAGCGPGVHSIRVAKAGHPVCAIDVSDTMLNQARDRAKSENVADKIDFYNQDLTHLDFPDNSFRYIFSWGVIIHIPEVEKALGELTRVLEPGGKLALYITNKSAIDKKIESFFRFFLNKPLKDLQCLQLGDGVWYDMNGEKLWLWRFETAALTQFLQDKGLRLIHSRIGELSEIQRRLNGTPRNLLLRLNNLAYQVKLPKFLATTQLLIFEKQ